LYNNIGPDHNVLEKFTKEVYGKDFDDFGEPRASQKPDTVGMGMDIPAGRSVNDG
jgi:hypothetical protein